MFYDLVDVINCDGYELGFCCVFVWLVLELVFYFLLVGLCGVNVCVLVLVYCGVVCGRLLVY